MTRRSIWLSIAGTAVSLMLLPSVVPLPPVLLWNGSASVPIGLYAVHPAGTLRVGDIVVVRPPEPLARYPNSRRALPDGVPLIKPIAALAGQMVCRIGGIVSVDGVTLAKAQDRDRHGRKLPVWQGCRLLGPAEIFLMNAAQPDSLDGRYFGVLPTSTVIGRATPLWLPKAP